MITLYDGITTTTSPATFTGLPFPLNDVIDCTVTEERNGQFSLAMRYPIGGAYWAKIIPDAIIMASPRPNADPEPFRIYEIEQVIEGVVTARANHIVYDLDGLGPFSISAITEYWTNLDDFISSVNTGWFQYRNMCFLLVNDGLTSTSTIPQGTGVMQTLWAVIGYIANAFNAELKYEWVNGVCVITFCAARGVQKPTIISYGVNLVALDRKLYTGDLYSSVCAYYNNANDLIYGWANTPYTARERTLFVNVTDKFNSVPTQEEIDAAAQEYVDTHDFNPLSDLSVEFVPLQNTTDYQTGLAWVGTAVVGVSVVGLIVDNSTLYLCDTATVDASLIGVTATAKCVLVVYNVITEKYDKVTVGTIQSDIVDTILKLEG